ncbi:extracellular solute-binding protein [Acerihabitans sp.]|uniref:extracellular solute-binding protein n=1 Tax=Acerihabitans sp. TaxID=2811394 RepID=UPI002ED9CA37
MSAKKVLTIMAALALFAGMTLPAWADPVTIRVVSKDLLSTNPDDVRLLKNYEAAMKAKGTDLHIQIVDLPSAGYSDKLSAMLLAGNIPDLIYFQKGDQKMAEQGILEDWNKWLPQTTYLKNALYPHNVARLKNYPYLLYIFPPRVAQPVIRQDWLAKTGLAAPKTVDDYVALFQAIKTGDLDGNGKADTFAITMADNTDDLDAIFNQAFGISKTWIKQDNGQWINSRISNQEKNKIAFYASLRAKGLLDPEYITTKWNVKEDKFYSGQAGIIFANSAENAVVYDGKMRQAAPGANPSLILLAPPKGPAGQGLAALDVAKESRGFAIATTSQHKAEVVKFLDFVASPEGQQIEQLGFAGEQYTKDGDTLKPTEKMGTWYCRFISAANWQPPAQLSVNIKQQFLQSLTVNTTLDDTFVWPTDYAEANDSAENVYRAWIYRFILGSAKMDQWDQYVAEWKSAGGEQMTTYARSVLDAK